MSFVLWPECHTPREAEEKLLLQERLMCPPNISFQRYLGDLQSSGQAQCTFVWTKGTVAYRCRTCQVNDSSAICVGCFLKGDHKLHDYVMYHSESGGCCDCGDADAWQISGFCSAHQSLERLEPCVPAPLEDATKLSVGWVLRNLSLVVRYIAEFKNGPPTSKKDLEGMAIIFLNWLQKVCSVDALRKIVCLEVMEKRVVEKGIELKAPLQILLRSFASMPEDIMEGETTLYLQMLYDTSFKQQFSEEFVEHYQYMIEYVVAKVVKDANRFLKDFRALDSSLDRVMVQLFNVPNMDLIKKKNLLKLFVDVFGGVLERCVKGGIVDVGDARIENKVYLRPQGDLRLIVAHTSVARHVLEDRLDVFNAILDVLTLLQWMNPYRLRKEVDFEDDNAWTLAIQLEMNTMAIVFQLVVRCYTPDLEGSAESSKLTLISAAKCTLTRLRKYLAQKSTMDLLNKKSLDTPVSLHIPLHRTLSAILAKLVLLPWKDEKEGFLSSLQFDYSEDEVLALMEHPLRITVWMAQIRANQWFENSDDFNRLELIYRGSFWHDQSMDMDILLLQFCAVARENMERAIFMRMAERFELKELVSSPLIHHEKIGGVNISLLQDFMRLILLVVRERRNTGMKEEDCLRYDVIQWLCVRDQTYSQLCRALSAIPVDHKRLNEMLEKVAHFHDPKVQERGYYQLKAECWQDFDPLFAHFYLNELEDAQERAIHVGKLQHYWRIKTPGGAKPPYNRLINLLHTEGCHQLLWNVFNYVSSLVMNESTATAGEALGVIALQMMGIALQDRGENPEEFPAETWQQPMVSCNDIFQNVHRRPYFNQYTKVVEWGIHAPEYPSILDFLGKLQLVKNAPRLVDSVYYVLHLLKASPFTSPSGDEPKEAESSVSPKSHARVYTMEDEDRNLKKQRQEAIMAQFKAKQKAFWDQYDVSDDEDDGTPDASVGNAEAGSSVTSSSPSSIKVSLDARGQKLPMEAPLEVYECAFCRSECGGNDKSTGWIALVQRYNMPNVVMMKGTDVSSIAEADAIAKGTNVGEADKTPSDSDGKQLVVYMGKDNMIDHIPTEHVRCCGHQMHQVCFQSYHASLVRSHCGQTTYEGKNIIELNKAEFLCPICRRLANVLLPVVQQASLSRTLLAHEDDDMTAQRKNWMHYWDTRKNLPGAIDEFAVQSLRVRNQFFEGTEAKDISKCPVLWEVFAGNIIHCEVETREELKEIASSSTAPTLLSDQRSWGGDSGHWVAIRELGKLAMLSNTLETAQEMETKRCNIHKLRTEISQILSNGDVLAQNQHFKNVVSSLHNTLVGLQNTIEQIYEPQQQMGDVSMEEERSHESGKTQVLDKPVSNVNRIGPSRPGYREETRRDLQIWPSTQDPPMAQFHDARGMPDFNGVAPGDEIENKGRGRVMGVESLCHSSNTGSCNQPEYIKYKTNWSASILAGNLLEADPFWLLILLLSAYPGWPKVDEILLLVKFSYTVAVTQILLACSSLQIDDDKGGVNLERDWGAVMQNACLPFLRRAALLMHVITREDFKMKHSGPGRKVMDATYLQQELGLTDSHRMFTSSKGDGEATIDEMDTSPSSQQLHLCRSLIGAEPKLKEVPIQLHLAKLPSVFQELLLRSIRETCTECGEIPLEPAVCLVCGVFFCCGTDCCEVGNKKECSRHAEDEGAGIGIFLLMRSTQLVLIRGSRVCMAPSLYLDQHGEDACGERQDELDSYGPEDTYLRRSQLLHLSELRLNEVRRLWLTAGFDYDTHILHTSQISPGAL